MSRLMMPETFPKGGRRGKGGIRGDLGFFVRSRWEANYCRYLKWLVDLGEIRSWEYEKETFRFPLDSGTRTYTPDFKVTNKNGTIEYHEVKGWMDPKSATQIKRMQKYYPQHSLILIDKKIYYAIARKVKKIIPYWEHG